MPDVVIVPNVRTPEELFCNEIASVPPVTDVFPKLAVTVDPETRMPCVVMPERVVLPNATVPPTVVSETPAPVLLVEVRLTNADVAANVPVVRFNA